MKRKKTVTMLVTVSVPVVDSMGRKVTAAMARREVRSLVNDQCNYSLDYDEIHVRKIQPVRA